MTNTVPKSTITLWNTPTSLHTRRRTPKLRPMQPRQRCAKRFPCMTVACEDLVAMNLTFSIQCMCGFKDPCPHGGLIICTYICTKPECQASSEVNLRGGFLEQADLDAFSSGGDEPAECNKAQIPLEGESCYYFCVTLFDFHPYSKKGH